MDTTGPEQDLWRDFESQPSFALDTKEKIIAKITEVWREQAKIDGLGFNDDDGKFAEIWPQSDGSYSASVVLRYKDDDFRIGLVSPVWPSKTRAADTTIAISSRGINNTGHFYTLEISPSDLETQDLIQEILLHGEPVRDKIIRSA